MSKWFFCQSCIPNMDDPDDEDILYPVDRHISPPTSVSVSTSVSSSCSKTSSGSSSVRPTNSSNSVTSGHSSQQIKDVNCTRIQVCPKSPKLNSIPSKKRHTNTPIKRSSKSPRHKSVNYQHRHQQSLPTPSPTTEQNKMLQSAIQTLPAVHSFQFDFNSPPENPSSQYSYFAQSTPISIPIQYSPNSVSVSEMKKEDGPTPNTFMRQIQKIPERDRLRTVITFMKSKNYKKSEKRVDYCVTREKLKHLIEQVTTEKKIKH